MRWQWRASMGSSPAIEVVVNVRRGELRPDEMSRDMTARVDQCLDDAEAGIIH